MLTEERKSFLSDVVTKYKEVKGWAAKLTSSEDRVYLSSQGLKGFDVLLVVWVFVPLMWAINTSFQGVPFFVSFLKRRLKRTSVKEKVQRRKNRDCSAAKASKPTGKIIKLKCCKDCVDAQVGKQVARDLADRKAKTVEGKGPSTRKNYLKRLKKRLYKTLKRDLLMERSVQSFEPALDSMEGWMWEGVSEMEPLPKVVGQPAIMTRKRKREVRSLRRRQEVLEGKRKLPIAVLVQQALIYKTQFPAWVLMQFKLHFSENGEAVATSREAFRNFIHCAGLDLGYKLASQLGNEYKPWAHVASIAGKMISKRSDARFQVSRSSSNSSSSESSSSKRSDVRCLKR